MSTLDWNLDWIEKPCNPDDYPPFNVEDETDQKFNPIHDPHSGRFGTRGEYGMAGLSESSQNAIVGHLAANGITIAHMVENGSALMETAKHDVFLCIVYKQTGSFVNDKEWFDRAHSLAGAMSKRYGFTPDQAAGVIAATSPRQAWDGVSQSGKICHPNAKAAYTAMKVLKNDTPVTITSNMVTKFREYDKAGRYESETQWASLVGKTVKPSQLNSRQLGFLVTPFSHSFPENNTKAFKILRGESPDSVLGGPKVRSFFNNIKDPQGKVYATVDTWMMRVLSGDKNGDATKLSGILMTPQVGELKHKGSYPAFVEATTQIALKYGVTPAQAQSIIWSTSRRRVQ